MAYRQEADNPYDIDEVDPNKPKKPPVPMPYGAGVQSASEGNPAQPIAPPRLPVNQPANPPSYSLPPGGGNPPAPYEGNDTDPFGAVPPPVGRRTNNAVPYGDDVIANESTGGAAGKDPVAFIRDWQQSHPAGGGIGPLADALKAAGYDTPRFMYGQTPSNNELVVGGQKYKVMGAENSSNPFWYRGEDDSAPGAGGAGAGAGGSASGSFSTSRDPRSGALYDLLMKRATQGLDVNADDPIIKGQTDAFNAQGQRAAKNYETGLAERAGPNANIEAEMRSASEKVGQDTGAFQAQLMGGELSARRQEIQQALTGAAGMLTEEQRMQLQQELAQLELAERHYQFGAGLGQQESEFERNLRQRGFEFDINDQYRNSPLGA